MSEDDAELSPLQRLLTRVQLRRMTEEDGAALSYNPNVRSEADIRVATFKLVEAEIRTAIVEVAKAHVDRIVADRDAKKRCAARDSKGVRCELEAPHPDTKCACPKALDAFRAREEALKALEAHEEALINKAREAFNGAVPFSITARVI